MSGFRIDNMGARLERDKPVSFEFDGQRLQGFAGDTLASAVLASGRLLLSRSWKYHRPRGIVTSGIEEPSALVQIGSGALSIPNAKMPEVELYEGLRSESVNPWPGALKYLLSVNRWFTPLFPAGFYYKTFMWPAKAWLQYEKFIRRAGGLGAAPSHADTDRYVQQNQHCDVLIADGGVAGLTAALAAGRSGARVILAELQPQLGGSAHRLPGRIDGLSALDWVRAAENELASMPEVRILRRSVVFGQHDHSFLTIREALTDHLPVGQRKGFRERLWRVRARQVILATGAHERPMVFGNNDLPGVMLCSAMADYAALYSVCVGRNIVLATNNDSAYGDALLLRQAGAQVSVVDVRAGDVPPAGSARLAREAGVVLLRGFVPLLARGAGQVSSLLVRELVDGRASGEQRSLACDAVGMSGGWNPAIHLHSHAGGKALWSESRSCFEPVAANPSQSNVGACKGQWTLREALAEAADAGASAARRCGFDGVRPSHRVDEPDQQPIEPFWVAETGESLSRRAKAFVDWQNDVAASDIELAVREGFGCCRRSLS